MDILKAKVTEREEASTIVNGFVKMDSRMGIGRDSNESNIA